MYSQQTIPLSSNQLTSEAQIKPHFGKKKKKPKAVPQLGSHHNLPIMELYQISLPLWTSQFPSRSRSGWACARALYWPRFRIIFLGSKVSKGCDNISYERSHIRLLLDTHCSNGKSLIHSPHRILTLEQWISNLPKFPPILEQGAGLQQRVNEQKFARLPFSKK